VGHNTPRLRLSICRDLMLKMKCGDGQAVRLDIDAVGGMGRLLCVMGGSTGVQRMRIKTPSTGRGAYEMTWTGEAPLFFPASEMMTELKVIEVKADELIFELPVKAEPSTTEGSK
jgi:hypothetical protein